MLNPLATHVVTQQNCLHGAALLDEVEKDVFAVNVLAHREESAFGSAGFANELGESLLSGIPNGLKVAPLGYQDLEIHDFFF
ncbi:hypothetical protein D3C85_1529990 [compost metagenome]